MQAQWTEDASRTIGEIARRHGFSEDAGRAMADALNHSAGAMAQFHHPDLGGMGQWSRGGMLMIGDMFNNSLKGRVAGLAEDLAAALGSGAIAAQRPAYGESSSGYGQWWPAELGSPSSTGAQNDRRYAVFPQARRLAVETGGRVTLYDTGDHRIGGASQQQGGGSSLSFSTDRGTVGIEQFGEIRETRAEIPEQPAAVSPPDGVQRAEAPDQSQSSSQYRPHEPSPQPFDGGRRAADPAATSPARALQGDDPVELIRKLATLKDAGVLTEDEFRAKKTELLARI